MAESAGDKYLDMLERERTRRENVRAHQSRGDCRSCVMNHWFRGCEAHTCIQDREDPRG